MKLAEALLLRGDLQRALASLRERIGRNTLVQEDERPSEDTKALLSRAEAIIRAPGAHLRHQRGEPLGEDDQGAPAHALRWPSGTPSSSGTAS